MSMRIRIGLSDPALPFMASFPLEEARDDHGIEFHFGGREGGGEARVTYLPKLPAFTRADGIGGQEATSDEDASIAGITLLFSISVGRGPTEDWEKSLELFYQEFRQFSTWTPAAIVINGSAKPGFRLRYMTNEVFVASEKDYYLIVALNPAIPENPNISLSEPAECD